MAARRKPAPRAPSAAKRGRLEILLEQQTADNRATIEAVHATEISIRKAIEDLTQRVVIGEYTSRQLIEASHQWKKQTDGQAERLSAHVRQLSAHSLAIDQLRGAVTLYSNDIRELKEASAEHTATIAEHTAAIAELKEATAANTAAIAELKVATAANTAAISDNTKTLREVMELLRGIAQQVARSVTREEHETLAQRVEQLETHTH